MANGKHIKVLLDFGHLFLRDDSVVQVQINEDAQIGTREASKLMATISGLSHYTSRPVVLDLRNVEVDTAAKLYFLRNHEEIHNQASSVAMIIDSVAGRWLANFSLLFRRLARPTRYFTSEEAAIKWSQRHLAPSQGDLQSMAA